MEKVNYLNQPNCYRLSNGTVEAIVTTDVGPRIIRYGFPGEENILGEVPDSVIKTELGDWKPFGGHRLWAAPEAKPRSYAPDNSPVEYDVLDDHTIRLIQRAEPPTYLQKEMTVKLYAEGSGLHIHHRLTNGNLWAIDVAPWALTVMNGGGMAILPQEPHRSWDEYLLPARPMVLWYYTDLSDPRWSFSKKYITLKTDSERTEPQKIGIANKLFSSSAPLTAKAQSIRTTAAAQKSTRRAHSSSWRRSRRYIIWSPEKPQSMSSVGISSTT